MSRSSLTSRPIIAKSGGRFGRGALGPSPIGPFPMNGFGEVWTFTEGDVGEILVDGQPSVPEYNPDNALMYTCNQLASQAPDELVSFVPETGAVVARTGETTWAMTKLSHLPSTGHIAAIKPTSDASVGFHPDLSSPVPDWTGPFQSGNALFSRVTPGSKIHSFSSSASQCQKLDDMGVSLLMGGASVNTWKRILGRNQSIIDDDDGVIRSSTTATGFYRYTVPDGGVFSEVWFTIDALLPGYVPQSASNYRGMPPGLMSNGNVLVIGQDTMHELDVATGAVVQTVTFPFVGSGTWRGVAEAQWQAVSVTIDPRGDVWISLNAATSGNIDILRYAPDLTYRHSWGVDLDPGLTAPLWANHSPGSSSPPLMLSFTPAGFMVFAGEDGTVNSTGRLSGYGLM